MKYFAFIYVFLFALSMGVAQEQSTKGTKTAQSTLKEGILTPQRVVTKFTLTVTPFLQNRVAWAHGQCGSNRATGFQHPNIVADFLPTPLEGNRWTFHRTKKGEYQIGDSAINCVNFAVLDKYGGWDTSRLTDVSVELLKEILGADALSNVVEASDSEIREKDGNIQRAAIVDALKRSEGNTAQAAARTNLTEKELLEKMRGYGIKR